MTSFDILFDTKSKTQQTGQFNFERKTTSITDIAAKNAINRTFVHIYSFALCHMVLL